MMYYLVILLLIGISSTVTGTKCLFGKWPNIHEEKCEQYPDVDKFRGCMAYYDGSHLNFGCIDSTMDTQRHCDVDQHGKILECCFTENCNNMKKKLVDRMSTVVNNWNKTRTCYVGSSLTHFTEEKCVSVKNGGHYIGCLTKTYEKNGIIVNEKSCLTAHTALNNCILKLSKRSNGNATYNCCYKDKCNEDIINKTNDEELKVDSKEITDLTSTTTTTTTIGTNGSSTDQIKIDMNKLQ